MGINAFEPVEGTWPSFLKIVRGRVPTREFVLAQPWYLKPGTYLICKLHEHGWTVGEHWLPKRPEGAYDFTEAYNLDHTRQLRLELESETKLSLVGGVRKVSTMVQALEEGCADFISLSRPLIRDYAFVKKVKDGDIDESQCTNCNTCAGGLFSAKPAVHYPRAGRLPTRIAKNPRLWNDMRLG